MCGICCVVTLRRKKRRPQCNESQVTDLAWLEPERVGVPSPAEAITRHFEGVGRLVANRGPDCTCAVRMMYDCDGGSFRLDGRREPAEGVGIWSSEFPAALSQLCNAGQCSVVCQGSVLSLRGVPVGACESWKTGSCDSSVPVKQPVLCHDCNSSSAAAASWLLWNGEVFGGTLSISLSDCDTLAVLHELRQLEHRVSQLPADSDRETLLSGEVALFFERRVEGPYAFIYFASSLNFLVFGRDPTGRRSLVACNVVWSGGGDGSDSSNEVKRDDDGDEGSEENEDVEFQQIVISSVGKRFRDDGCSNATDKCEGHANWKEVPVSGVFGIQMALKEAGRQCEMGVDSLRLCCARWNSAFHGVHPLLREREVIDAEMSGDATCAPAQDHSELTSLFRSVCSEVRYEPDVSIDSSRRAAELYGGTLLDAVRRRVLAAHCGGDPTRPVAVLFSGGIDSTVLAAMAHYCLPLETPIELINVAFRSNPEQTPDRIAAFRSARELVRLPLFVKPSSTTGGSQTREWRLVLVDVSNEELAESQAHLRDIINPSTTVMDHDIGAAVWFAARGVGRMQKLNQQEIQDRMNNASDELRAEEVGDNGFATIAQAANDGAKQIPGLSFHKHFRVAVGAVSSGPPAESLTVPLASRSRSAQEDREGPGSAMNSTPRAVELQASTCMLERPLSTKRPRHEGERTDLNSNGPSSPNSNEGHSQLFAPLVEALIAEGYDDIAHDGSEHSLEIAGVSQGVTQHKIVLPKGRVLLSTLGKEYGALLTPIWTGHGYKKLGQYLNDAERAGYIRYGSVPQPQQRVEDEEDESERASGAPHGTKNAKTKRFQGSTVKYVVLARSDDIQRAKALKYNTTFTYHEDDSTEANTAPPPVVEGYRCIAKIVLLGMGADETLGGYVRYERSFAREGSQAVMNEMSRDYSRLWQRNLGRDDRCVADCGREGRFPFLDERVIHSLEGVVSNAKMVEGNAGTWQSAISDVCSFTEGPGIGDKKLLRTVARMLGLQDVSRLQKRAIQFGSRIANSKTRGSAALNEGD